jgi:hypothetical protein
LLDFALHFISLTIILIFLKQKYTELAKKDREREKKEMKEYNELARTIEGSKGR